MKRWKHRLLTERKMLCSRSPIFFIAKIKKSVTIGRLSDGTRNSLWTRRIKRRIKKSILTILHYGCYVRSSKLLNKA